MQTALARFRRSHLPQRIGSGSELLANDKGRRSAKAGMPFELVSKREVLCFVRTERFNSGFPTSLAGTKIERVGPLYGGVSKSAIHDHRNEPVPITHPQLFHPELCRALPSDETAAALQSYPHH
jgi:hypothetical protein